MNWLWEILGFIVAISVLVAVHEFGHFWVARRLGFKVVRFSIGFGKPLWKRVAGTDRIEYVIAAIPLGGYVKLLDEREAPVPEADLPRSFTRKPVSQRLLVLAAGPGFNFLFAIVAYWILFMSGMPSMSPRLGEIRPDSPAAEAGLQKGDILVAVDGERTADTKQALFALLQNVLDDGRLELRVKSASGAEREVTLEVPGEAERHRLTEPGALLPGLGFEFDPGPVMVVVAGVLEGKPAERAGLQRGDRIIEVEGVPATNGAEFTRAIERRAGQRATLTIERDGERLRVPVDVESERTPDGRVVGRIGVQLVQQYVPHRERFGPVAALGHAAGETWEMSRLTVNLLWNMVMGRVSVKNISGPLNIAAFAGETARAGVFAFLSFLAIVSISLGILNLLPIPILDGGQMVFQAIEGIKGSPLSERAQVFGQQVGIGLLLLLMTLAFYNDITSRLAD